ncbi:hypothetical protein Dtox_2514 [Desulfofarcimen acetoxidans DSM 771]|uniref:Conjugal transfer protein TrbC n=1 Tax=Desulfofarcimen acetoxidans (strain ATCC 49208 / DSM 771 / KCTC 5769 / VKM B-1644 / 5575) TaxID=485916 RepID=C8W0R3_DESAS|nr:hypothetical protein Dtox_2514 [Desulfofarcimen acetoxidans DSM 771]
MLLKKFLLPVLIPVILLFTVPNAFAAGGFDFAKGAINILTLAKVLVVIAVVIAFIVELFMKRNIVYIFAVIIIAGILLYNSEPGKLAQFGHSVMMYVGGEAGVGTQEIINPPEKSTENNEQKTTAPSTTITP